MEQEFWFSLSEIKQKEQKTILFFVYFLSHAKGLSFFGIL